MQVRSTTRAKFNLRSAIPLFIFLLGTFCILFHLGTCGLLETSEGRYASVGRAMLDSGDWLIPVHNGLRHLTKPPFTYWASAAGMKIFGINEFGARFFLAFAAGFTALGCFYIARILFNLPVAIFSALILICSMFFQIQFRGLTTDPYLTMFETMMALGFIKFVGKRSRRRKNFWKHFFWLMAGLAMLTKGPPGLLPLAGLIPAAYLSRRKDSLKELFKSGSGWALFLCVGLGWYLYLAIKIPGLLKYFLVDETLNRVASGQHQRSAPFYMYFLLLPAGIFPWTSFFIKGCKDFFANFKNNFNSKLLLLWLFVPLAIFTLSRSKLAAYVLPLLVPMAIITAASVLELFYGLKARLAELRFHLRLVSGFLILIGMAMVIHSFSGQIVAENLRISLRFSAVIWFFLAGILIAQTSYGNRLISLAMLCFVAPGLIFFSIPGIRGNEELKPGKYMTSQWLLLKRIANLPPEQQIINLEEMIEGWYFYTGRNPVTWNVSRVTQFDQEQAKRLVLTGNEELKKNVDGNSMLVVRRKDLGTVASFLDCRLKTVASEGIWLVTVTEGRMRGHD